MKVNYYTRGYTIGQDGVMIKDSDYKYWLGMSEKYDVTCYLKLLRYTDHQAIYSKSCSNLPFEVRLFKNKISTLIGPLFATLSQKSTIHFFYFPNTLNFPAFLVAVLLRRRIISYMGNDLSTLGETNYNANPRYINKIKWLLYHYMQKVIYRRSCLVLVAGQQLYAQYKYFSRNIHPTQPFISFSSSDMQNVPFDRSYTARSNRILYVGVLSRRKRVSDLIRSTVKLLEEGEDIWLTIAGDGPERGILTALCATELSKERINFKGYVADISVLRDLYLSHGILVLPSEAEGFPRVIYEAFIHGLAVIATTVGGIPDALENRKSALLFSVGDCIGLENHIKTVLHDQHLIEELRENSKNIVRTLNIAVSDQHSDLIAKTKEFR